MENDLLTCHTTMFDQAQQNVVVVQTMKEKHESEVTVIKKESQETKRTIVRELRQKFSDSGEEKCEQQLQNQVLDMETKCDIKLNIQETNLKQTFTTNLKDLNTKFEVIQNKKVAEVQDLMNKKCVNEKQTLNDSLKSKFDAEVNQIKNDIDQVCDEKVESSK